MYSLTAIDAFEITSPENTYVYDIVPCAAGLAAISSDDSLRLLDPLALSGPPLNAIPTVNEHVTCLKVAEEEGSTTVIVTAGRDGRVCLIDPRTGARVGECRSGEFVAFLSAKI